VLGYLRFNEKQRALIFANFSENQVVLPANLLRLYGMSYQYRDMLLGKKIPPGDLTLGSYDFYALMPV
jgi:amylosucrase